MNMYLDEDVTERIARPLRGLGHAVVHANEVGRKGRTDPQQLAYASAHGRMLVTCNRKDFIMLHEAWTLCPHGLGGRQQGVHAGIAIVPNSSRISDTELASIIDQLAREVEAAADRLYDWRRDQGWQLIAVA